MPLADIGAMPVGKVTRPTTTLFLWCPQALIEDGLWLIPQWGFRYSGSAIIWYKTGRLSGTGHFARMIHEVLLIGIKDHSPTWGGHIASVIEAPRPPLHSQKPDVFYETIEKAVPGPYLELFARRRREGWTCCGDQLPKM